MVMDTTGVSGETGVRDELGGGSSVLGEGEEHPTKMNKRDAQIGRRSLTSTLNKVHVIWVKTGEATPNLRGWVLYPVILQKSSLPPDCRTDGGAWDKKVPQTSVVNS